MSEHQPDWQAPTPPVETRDPVVFAPRIAPELREQIEGVRKLTGQTINEIGTEALTDWVAKKLGDEELREKALAEIDAEEQRLQERRSAIASILGGAASQTTAEVTPTSNNAGSGRRTSGSKKD